MHSIIDHYVIVSHTDFFSFNPPSPSVQCYSGPQYHSAGPQSGSRPLGRRPTPLGRLLYRLIESHSKINLPIYIARSAHKIACGNPMIATSGKRLPSRNRALVGVVKYGNASSGSHCYL